MMETYILHCFYTWIFFLKRFPEILPSREYNSFSKIGSVQEMKHLNQGSEMII